MMVLDESPLCYSPFLFRLCQERDQTCKRLVSFLFSEDHAA